MPFQKVDGTVFVVANNTITTHYDYDIARTPSTNQAYILSIQVTVDDATPAPDVFPSSGINPVTNTLTLANHGLVTGLIVQFTTSDTLPSGLSAATDYYVIVVNSSTIKVADSLANALAGVAVPLVDAGVGDQTATATGLSTVITLQRSNDGVNYRNADPPHSLTASESSTDLWDLGVVTYKFVRVLIVPTAGVANITLTFNAVNLS